MRAFISLSGKKKGQNVTVITPQYLIASRQALAGTVFGILYCAGIYIDVIDQFFARSRALLSTSSQLGNVKYSQSTATKPDRTEERLIFPFFFLSLRVLMDTGQHNLESPSIQQSRNGLPPNLYLVSFWEHTKDFSDM